MLARVPLGDGQKGMSTQAHLVLDVHTFDIKGSIGEDQWGKPSDIELHSDVRLWVDGLRRGGGGGCVKVLFAYMFLFLKPFIGTS